MKTKKRQYIKIKKIEKNKFDEIYKTKRKRQPILVKYIDKHVSDRALELIEDCSTDMSFVTNLEKNKLKQITGNSCKNRFCVMCSYRRARKDSMKISTVMNGIEKLENKSFALMTLTYRRVKGDGAEDIVNKMNKALHLFFKRKEIKKMNLGYIKKSEITYDKEEYITKSLFKKKSKYYRSRDLKVGDENPTYDTYHVHFHIILCVENTYFTDENVYLKRERLLRLWQESIRDYSVTQLDVRRIETIDNANAINEIAKYSAKDSDYLYSQSVFDVFYKALKGRQLITYSGIFKEYVKKFENGQLDEFKEEDKTEYVYLLEAKWIDGDYEKKYTLIEDLPDYRKELLKKFMVLRE